MRISAGVLAAVLVAGCVLGAGVAVAGPKIVFYQSGEDIFATGPLPPPYDKAAQLNGAEAAYKCSVFGILWAYLHIWNCEPVAVRGNKYFQTVELAAELAITAADDQPTYAHAFQVYEQAPPRKAADVLLVIQDARKEAAAKDDG